MLKTKKQLGKIKDFELQPRLLLQDKFKYFNHDTGKYEHVRKTEYILDFKVTHLDGHVEYIDVKGPDNAVAKLKLKLAKGKYPHLDLRWVAESKKYGDAYGWIDWFELQKIRKSKKV